MKTKYKYIKGVLLLGAVIFLFAFAEKRNSKREWKDLNLSFSDTENLYITEKAVNKLLIQKFQALQGEGKEPLDLNMMESLLDTHPMIENAEVFLGLNGELGAIITQRKPIGRVMGEPPYYIDHRGEKMPLSSYYSARVPLVRGVLKEEIKTVFPLLNYITNDPFLSRQVIAIEQRNTRNFILRMRELDFVVVVGAIENLELKFKNYKAFYKQVKSQNKLQTYTKVDLQFGNQVVCTK